MMVEVEKVDKIGQLKDLVNERIASLPIASTQSNLYEPIRYILDLGGKRFRPILALLSYSLFKDDYKSFVEPALGTEVFHNFTLIHDDIMDNAPLRRSMPTVHMKWKEEVAILSGDTMLVLAYQLILKNRVNTLKAMDAFNHCGIGVCEGQQLDMDFEEKDDVSIAEYLEMIRLKTAVLLGFCMEYGAIAAGASDKDCALAQSFGENMGIGFQLQDDILDVFGERAKVGKQVGGDIISNKKTYLWIKAYELANPKQREEISQWAAKETFDPAEKVAAIQKIYDDVNVLDHAQREMDEYFQKAWKDLEDISVPEEKKADLRSFASRLIKRDK